MADEPISESSVARRDLLRGGLVSAALVWTTPKMRSVRLLAAPGTPSETTTTPTTPPSSACPGIAFHQSGINGFSLGGNAFDAGDVVTVTVGFPASSPTPPTTIDLLVEREDVTPFEQFIQHASFPNTLTFTFPETGFYLVQANVNDGLNATFTASCGPAAG